MSTSQFKLLYVCNGDNARAPLASACTHLLTEATRHPGLAWEVGSAGTDQIEGEAVRPEALRAGAIVGVDLNGNEPRLLTSDLCEQPDLILAMSWEQVSHIWSLVPGAWEKVFTVKEFVHWAKQAPVRPPILFADRAEHMRDKVMRAHAIRKRARADYGFWGGIRPQDLNLIEPVGKGDEAWSALARAVHALTSDVITLLVGPETNHTAKPKPKPKPKTQTQTVRAAQPRAKAKAKAKR